MNKAVMAWIAIVALVVSLASTIIAIWFQCTPKNDLLDLTKLLLSWQVIAGGLAAGAASTFHEEIRGLLKKI
jgi:hypothetical protein